MCGSELELILIFFLDFSAAEAISHTSCVGEDIELRSAEPPLLAARLQPPSGLDTKTMQNNKLAIIHYLPLDIYFIGPSDL